MYVITHKHFDYHDLPDGYVPLLVGADKNPNPDNFLADNSGINISSKNPYYCEETGLFWLWKHSTDNRIGISHYRRFFAPFNNRTQMNWYVLFHGKSKIASVSYLDNILNSGYDWIVSQTEQLPFDSLRAQFAITHHEKDLDQTRKVISQISSDYVDDFDRVLDCNNEGSFYNMFYTSKDELNAYCSWLFPILFEVDKKTDISNYSVYQQRLYGFLAERLFNVWLHHRHAKIKYLPVYEKQSLTRTKILRIVGHNCKHKIKQVLHL